MFAGAAAGRTTAWSFTPIPVEFIGESSSEIAMLRSLGRLSQSSEGSECPTGINSLRSLPAPSSEAAGNPDSGWSLFKVSRVVSVHQFRRDGFTQKTTHAPGENRCLGGPVQARAGRATPVGLHMLLLILSAACA